MADQKRISVTTMYHARCGICKGLFIRRNRAKAAQAAERCFATGIFMPYKADVGDIVIMNDWSGVSGGPKDRIVKIIERFFSEGTHYPRYVALAIDDPNDPDGAVRYVFGQKDFRLRETQAHE